MWDFICDWLPIVAFISGTGLGWLINALFESVRRKHLEKLYHNTSNANVALESQLVSKSKLEVDLGRTNTELEKLREEVKSLSVAPSFDSTLNLENETLRQKIKKLKTKSSTKVKSGGKNYVTDYQVFLSELEKSIKKAKKKAALPIKGQENQEKSKKSKRNKVILEKLGKKKKEKKRKKSKSKFDFYKQKYSGEMLSSTLKSKTEENRDLTYLYGITDQIQEILNENGIVSFSDLSNTKIAEIRAILSLAGEKYEKIDPLNWPIQARIADKGQWEILDEYKSKMEM